MECEPKYILTPDEMHMAIKYDGTIGSIDFTEITDVRYTEQGNFTICNIIGHDNMYAGVTKRRPDDKANKIAGRNISFMRALDRLSFGVEIYR